MSVTMSVSYTVKMESFELYDNKLVTRRLSSVTSSSNASERRSLSSNTDLPYRRSSAGRRGALTKQNTVQWTPPNRHTSGKSITCHACGVDFVGK